MLDKQPANKRPQNTTQRPSRHDQREVLGSLPQRDDIREYDLAHRDDTAAANALDGPTNKEYGKRLGDRSANNRAKGKEDDGHEQHLLATKYIGQGSNEGLAHGTSEQVRGTGPEGISCGALKINS